MYGMSHSLPSGMSKTEICPKISKRDAVVEHECCDWTCLEYETVDSRYAISPQDTEFTSSYPSPSSRRGVYNDFTGGSGMGSACNMPPTTSSSSLNCIGTGASNSGGGASGSGGSAGSSASGGGDGDDQQVEKPGTNLIVNYLPQDMTDRELYALFRTIGPINTCRIMRDFKTGYSFGYAFVDYTSDVDSGRAIKSLNGITVRNKRLKVSFARPGGESIKDTNLYVTNLPRSITDDQLDTIFGKYGSIVQKNILRDKLTGKPRGVAFVRYSKREEAQEAISALNNVIPEKATQPLSVRLAEEHGKAKAAHFLGQSSGNLGPPMPHSQLHMNPVGSGLGYHHSVLHRGRSTAIKSRFQKSHPYYNLQKFI